MSITNWVPSSSIVMTERINLCSRYRQKFTPQQCRWIDSTPVMRENRKCLFKAWTLGIFSTVPTKKFFFFFPRNKCQQGSRHLKKWNLGLCITFPHIKATEIWWLCLTYRRRKCFFSYWDCVWSLIFQTAYIPDELYKRVYDFCKRLLTYPHPYCTIGLSYTRQIKTERANPGII